MKKTIHAKVPPTGKAESYGTQGVGIAQNIISQSPTRYVKLFFVLCFCVLFSNNHKALGVSIQINTLEVCNDNGCEISKPADVGIIEIYQGLIDGLTVRINWDEAAVLQFFNVAGSLVHCSEQPSRKYVNIGTLPPGNYLVKAVTYSGRTERKLFVIH